MFSTVKIKLAPVAARKNDGTQPGTDPSTRLRVDDIRTQAGMTSHHIFHSTTPQLVTELSKRLIVIQSDSGYLVILSKQ